MTRLTTRLRLRQGVSAGVVLLVCLAGTALGASASHAAGNGAHGKSFTKTETITRDDLDNGKNHVVDRRTVTLQGNDTTDLRGRQEIGVSWSGAHPTGGIVADQNSIDAQQEEYPFVLLECRGIDSTKVKPADRLSQKTCWTQDWSERYQDTLQTDFPPYRLDRYGTTADRAQVVGAPPNLPAECNFLPAPTQHWVPFVAADGHTYYDGPAGCAGQPPESQSVGGSSLPSNETFGVTGLDGKGSAKFDIWTSAENASLGCTQLVACSLVAVPIMGISCDVAAKSLPSADRPPPSEAADARSQCEAKGAFAPGQIVTPQDQDDLAVSGSLWWSASNWRNRITVPLTFAVPDDACEVVSSSNDVDIYGSELLIQATGQWAPHFCLNPKLFNFTHVQTGEPEARNLLATGSAEAAFISDPPPDGYGRPVVNAPVAVTGFAITYIIDGANGQPYTKLRLTPLLLAKLLTESYPAVLPVQEEDPALARNPLNITLDPQFQKLNPGIPYGVDASQAASTLLALSSNSDVMEALTTYINDNPAARAWLNGKPDPYGMVVNPAYKDIKLPVEEWPLLSTFEPKTFYASGNNDCLKNSPVPYLPLVAAPLATLEDITEAMQFSVAQSTTQCSQVDGTTVGEKLVALGRQTVGFRFMIGVTAVADADRYQLNAAALQTNSADHFVGPTNESMKAATTFLKPDTKSGTWPVPQATLATSKKASGAYPGTMVVYAAMPTTGLPSLDAKDYAAVLRFAAGAGQRPGLGVGTLPPGYLPLTKANGLGQLANYTWAAAADVAAQKGKLPPMTGNPPVGTRPKPKPKSTPTPTPTPTVSNGGTPGGSSHVTVPTVKTDPSSPAASPSVATSPNTTATVSLGRTLGINLGGGGLVVLLVLGLAILGVLGAPATYFAGRKRGRW
jgi:ABC-type phosphate transport system substrate-binding protein